MQFRVKASGPRQTGPITTEYREKYTEKPLGMPRPVQLGHEHAAAGTHHVSVGVDTNSAPLDIPYAPQSEYRAEYVERPLESRSVGTGTPAGLPRKVAPATTDTSAAPPKPLSEYAAQYKAYPLPRTRTVAVTNPYADLATSTVPIETEPPLSEYARQYQWFGPPASERQVGKTVGTEVEERDLDQPPQIHEPFSRTEYQSQYAFIVPPRQALAHDVADEGTETDTSAPEPLRVCPLSHAAKFDATTEYQDRYKSWGVAPGPRAVRKVAVGDAGHTLKVTHDYDPTAAPAEVPRAAPRPESPAPVHMSYDTEYSARFVDPATVAHQPTAPPSAPVQASPAPEAAQDQAHFTEQDVERYQGWLEQLKELRQRAHSYKVRERKAAMDVRLHSLAKEQLQILQRTREHARHTVPVPAAASTAHREQPSPLKHASHTRFPVPVSAVAHEAIASAQASASDLMSSSDNQRSWQASEHTSAHEHVTRQHTLTHERMYHDHDYIAEVCTRPTPSFGDSCIAARKDQSGAAQAVSTVP